MKEFWRKLRRYFSGHREVTRENLFQEHSESFVRAKWLIRGFYCFILFIALQEVDDWKYGWMGDHMVHHLRLWPVVWLDWFPVEGAFITRKFAILGLMLFFTFGVMAAAIMPKYRLARIAGFLGLLFFVAMKYTPLKIGHSLHLLIFISALFVFLPTGWDGKLVKSRLIKQKTLLVFWTGQATIMLGYTLAGLIKIVVGIYQVGKGEVSMFHLEAVARHTAYRLFETNTEGFLSAFVIENLWVSGFLMVGTIYIELYAFWAMFRPRLMWFFAASLICFHIGTEMVMTIIFTPPCFLLALLIANNPLRSDSWTLKGFLGDLPLVGILMRKLGLAPGQHS